MQRRSFLTSFLASFLALFGLGARTSGQPIGCSSFTLVRPRDGQDRPAVVYLYKYKGEEFAPYMQLVGWKHVTPGMKVLAVAFDDKHHPICLERITVGPKGYLGKAPCGSMGDIEAMDVSECVDLLKEFKV